MDGTRPRRTRDPARQAWYALHRQWRFARWLGFQRHTEAETRVIEHRVSTDRRH